MSYHHHSSLSFKHSQNSSITSPVISSPQAVSHNRISSLAGLKSIVNPSPMQRKPAAASGGLISANSSINNNNNNHHSQSFGGLSSNFSQGQIFVQNHPQLSSQSQYQRSLSNSKQSNSSNSKHTMSSTNLKNLVDMETPSNDQFQQPQHNRRERDSPLKPPTTTTSVAAATTPSDHPLIFLKQQYPPTNTAISSKIASNTSTPPMTALSSPQHLTFNYPSSSSNSNSYNNNASKTSQNKKRAKVAASATATTTAASSPTNQQSGLIQSMQMNSNYNSFAALQSQNMYSGLDKQTHLQSIERIKENINKKLILQQQQSIQDSQAASPALQLQNKPNSSSSEHKSATGTVPSSTTNKNNSTAIVFPSNPMQSIRRKQMNNSINQTSNSNVNSNNNNNNSNSSNGNTSSYPLAKQHLNQFTTPTHENNINRFINQTIQNSTHLRSTIGGPSTDGFGDYSSLSRTVGGPIGAALHACDSRDKQQQQQQSTTKLLKKQGVSSKSNNQSMHSSSKNLQYIVQSKLSLNQTPCSSGGGSCNLPTNIPSSGSKSSSKALSKTTSFSSHSNQFYSPNYYSKQQHQSNPTAFQNQTFFGGTLSSKHQFQQQPQHQQNSHPKQDEQLGFEQSQQQQQPIAEEIDVSNKNYSSQSAQKVNSHSKSGDAATMIHLQDPPKVFIKNATISFSGVQQQSANNNNNNSNSAMESMQQSSQSQLSYSVANPLNVGQCDSKEVGTGATAVWLHQQRANCKVILSKLEAFDVTKSVNPYDHISEIMSLIHLCLVDTPLEKVLEKFDGNLQAIAAETRRRSKEILAKTEEKQKVIDSLNEVIARKNNNTMITGMNNNNTNHLQQQQQLASFSNKKPVEQATQTTPKRKRNKQENNEANSIIQICDQNGNVQEVDTDKENEMLRDYILDQEKKVNVFKEKEANMIKLLLAVKKQGVNIDEIYNNEVLKNNGGDISHNDDNDFVAKMKPLGSQQAQEQISKHKREKVDSKYFRQLDQDQAYADNSIVNDSDESSFGFYGKPSERSEVSVAVNSKQRAATNQKNPPSGLFKKATAVKTKQHAFKLDLESLKKSEAVVDNDDQENIEFHRFIMTTLQISQRTLDDLQEQIQNDPNQLSPEQLELIARIHAAQQEYDKKKGILVVDSGAKNNQYNGGDDDDYFDIDNSRYEGNILPSDLKEDPCFL